MYGYTLSSRKPNSSAGLVLGAAKAGVQRLTMVTITKSKARKLRTHVFAFCFMPMYSPFFTVPPTEQYVFRGGRFRPASPVDCLFSCVRLSLGQFYNLHHSVVYALRKGGCDAKDIRSWLGHSDVITALNVYGHLLSGDLTHLGQIIDSMDGCLSEQLTGCLRDNLFFCNLSGQKQEKTPRSKPECFGGDNRTRICDLSRVRRALYRLSYASMW